MKNEHNGRRRSRAETFAKRVPSLGYYMIFTDTEETEHNYINGLKRSVPEELRDKLVIKVIDDVPTDDLVNAAMNLISIHPQYGAKWIVFDRDKVKDFDKIIDDAYKHNIRVGWSNPCIEAWFFAYFDTMPNYADSVTCYDKFKQRFELKTHGKYKKNDEHIYEKLIKHGNEQAAIKLAAQKLKEHDSNGKEKPSEQCPATTLHILVYEIKSKIRT